MLIGLAVLVAAAAGAAALAINEPGETGAVRSLKELRPRLEGADPRLVAIYSQANRLLPGEVAAFERRLDELRGLPIVVNKWASWCGPCRAEFPHFQQVAKAHGHQIAFLGVDSDDNREDALEFLDEIPVPFPSYWDPRSEIAGFLQAAFGFPSTIFISRGGDLVHIKQGQYPSRLALEKDLELIE